MIETKSKEKTKENQTIHTKERGLRTMTSKNQIRWFTYFWCPSPEFPLIRIREKKAVDWSQILDSRKNSKEGRRPPNMNTKFLISQKEGCQRSIGRSIESQRGLVSEKTETKSQKMQFWKGFFCKERLALWCKGHESIIILFLRLLGSVGTLLIRKGSVGVLKPRKKVQKTLKLSWTLVFRVCVME
jgi:hypothetical protein